MDTTQLLLTVVLGLTTILLTTIGLQIFFTLREIRKTMLKVGRVVDSLENRTAVSQGVQEVANFFQVFKTVLYIVDFLGKKKLFQHEETYPVSSPKQQRSMDTIIDKMRSITSKKQKKFFVKASKFN